MNNKIKELKDLLFELDSKHSVSVPDTQQNINDVAQKIVKLFTIPVVSQRSELLKAEDKDVPFDDYVKKYFEEPKVELTYKSKKNKNVMTETELIRYYKRAMCL